MVHKENYIQIKFSNHIKKDFNKVDDVSGYLSLSLDQYAASYIFSYGSPQRVERVEPSASSLLIEGSTKDSS